MNRKTLIQFANLGKQIAYFICLFAGASYDFNSLIFSLTQPVSYSLACHVSRKVKYFGKVANV